MKYDDWSTGDDADEWTGTQAHCLPDDSSSSPMRKPARATKAVDVGIKQTAPHTSGFSAKLKRGVSRPLASIRPANKLSIAANFVRNEQHAVNQIHALMKGSSLHNDSGAFVRSLDTLRANSRLPTSREPHGELQGAP